MSPIRLAASILLAAATLAAALVPGVYQGKFQGETGGGDIRLQLRNDGDTMKADVSFTYEGREIKCHVIRVKTEGQKLNVTYQFEIGGMSYESAIEGDLRERTFHGTYRTKSLGTGAGVDSGRWEATAAE